MPCDGSTRPDPPHGHQNWGHKGGRDANPEDWSGARLAGRAGGRTGEAACGRTGAWMLTPPPHQRNMQLQPTCLAWAWLHGPVAWGPGLGLAWAWRGPMHGTPPSYPTCANATLSQISSLRFEMSAWTRTKIAVWQMHRGWGRVPARRIHIFEDMKISCDTIVWSFKTGGELILDWFEGYCSEVRLSCVG